MAEKEYIEREKLDKWLLTELASLDGEEDRKFVVERLRAEIPAADVRPVILCKDCIALRDGISYCMYWGEYVNDSGYCSYGKKREES